MNNKELNHVRKLGNCHWSRAERIDRYLKKKHIEEFVKNVIELGNENMRKTGILAGAHYNAMIQLGEKITGKDLR